MDTSPVFGVLLNRALALGSLAVASISLSPSSSEDKMQQLGKEVAAFASDLLLLEDELVKVKKTGKEKGRTDNVCGAITGLEAAHQALIIRSVKERVEEVDKILFSGAMTWTVQ